MNTGTDENMNTPRIPFVSCFRGLLSSSRLRSFDEHRLRRKHEHTTNPFHVLFQSRAVFIQMGITENITTHHEYLSCLVSGTCCFIQTGITENINTPSIPFMPRFRDLLLHSDGHLGKHEYTTNLYHVPFQRPASSFRRASRKTLTYRESLSCPVSETCFLIQTGITENINRHHESLSCPVSETCFLIQTGITENINTPRISIMSRFRDLLPHSDGHHGKH